jgi:AraC-like DNA-binding protein
VPGHVALGLDYYTGQHPYASDEAALATYRAHVTSGRWTAANYPPPPYYYPEGMETPDRLSNLTEALSRDGFSDAEVRNIMRENWVRELARTDRLRRAMLLLQERIAEPPSIGEVAEKLGVSGHHLQRLFRDEIGMTIVLHGRCARPAKKHREFRELSACLQETEELRTRSDFGLDRGDRLYSGLDPCNQRLPFLMCWTWLSPTRSGSHVTRTGCRHDDELRGSRAQPSGHSRRSRAAVM